MKNEIQEIKARYKKRKDSNKKENIWFSKYVQFEREKKYFEIIGNKFQKLGDKKIIEIGAGGGIIWLLLKGMVLIGRIYMRMNY